MYHTYKMCHGSSLIIPTQSTRSLINQIICSVGAKTLMRKIAIQLRWCLISEWKKRTVFFKSATPSLQTRIAPKMCSAPDYIYIILLWYVLLHQSLKLWEFTEFKPLTSSPQSEPTTVNQFGISISTSII